MGGVGITLCFSVGLLGTIRNSEARRQERPLVATLFGIVGVVGLALAGAGVVAALVVVA